MLADFQQALADLTASPDKCILVRHEPSFLAYEYELTEREYNRLIGIVRHPGMECACSLYRANRLAPLAMNAPDTCHAIGAGLRDVMEEFWDRYPETNVHFLVETDRFCRFVKEMLDTGYPLAPEVGPALARESEIVALGLKASRLEDYVRHI